MVNYIIENIGTDICNELNDKVKESLKLLQIKFSEITGSEIEMNLLEYIYENELYEINEEMLRNIFVYAGFKSTDYEQRSLSLILHSDKLERLKLYILNNKKQFIKKCFVNTNGIGNDINDIIYCINNWEIDYELKNMLVNKIYGKLDDISKVKDTAVYSSFLINDKMEISWENVYKVYCVTENFTEELIKYIEENFNILENKKIIFDVPENEKTRYINFRGKIARNNIIKLDVYKKLLSKLNIFLNTIEENEIENQRLSILIKMKILKLNVKNFNVVKKQNIDLLSEFVNLNIDVFIKDFDMLDLDIEDVERIILYIEIKNKYKTIILSRINVNCLSIKSIGYIIDNYKKTGITAISDEIKFYILNSNINIERKIDFINKELENGIEKEKIQEYLSYLPEPYSNIGDITQPQLSIPKTKRNESLIKKLKEIFNITVNPRIYKIVIYNKSSNKEK